MNAARTIEGKREDARDARYAVVASRFNKAIVGNLLDGAIGALIDNGVNESNITVVRVPGVFELPLTAKHLATNAEFDAVIALGAVIRGETPHFHYVARECARGLNEVALASMVPVIFGVLTTDNSTQAQARAAPYPAASSAENKVNGGTLSKDRFRRPINTSNKGAEAAVAAMEMVGLRRKLSRLS